jgi:transcriptional regulator
MYVPPSFAEERLDVLHDAIERAGLATLVTLTAGGLVASHVPMLLDRGAGTHGVLYGHLAAANHQWRDSLADAGALAIFLGPDAYISPSWYPSKSETGHVVPTWNYIAVHVYGRVTFFNDAQRLLDLVTSLTNRQESSFAEPWQVSDAPVSYIEGQLKGIVGFELPIVRIEGKWKVSQNRPAPDREGAARGLRERGGEASCAVARLVEERGRK